MTTTTPEDSVVTEFQAAQTDVTNALLALDVARGALSKLQRRARDIVIRGREISGHPKHNEPIASGARLAHRGKWGWVIEVRTQRYCGEGNYEIDEKPIIFPARWLAMPWNEWTEELRAMVVQREQRKAKREQDEIDKRKAQQEAFERAQFERLSAKYGGGQ